MSVVFETNPFPHPSNTSGSKAPLLQHPPQHLGGHSSVLSCNQCHWVLEGDGGVMWNACLWFFGSFIAWRGWDIEHCWTNPFIHLHLSRSFTTFRGSKKHVKFSLRVESFQRTILITQSFVWGAQRHGWIHQHTIFHPSEPSRKHIHSDSWKSQRSYQGATNGGLLLNQNREAKYDVTRWTCLEDSLQNCLPANSWNNVKVIMKQRCCKNHCIRSLGFMIKEKKNSLPKMNSLHVVSWDARCHNLLFRVDWKMSLPTLYCVQKAWESPILVAGLRNPATPAVQACLFFCSSLKRMLWNCHLEVQIKLLVGHSWPYMWRYMCQIITNNLRESYVI